MKKERERGDERRAKELERARARGMSTLKVQESIEKKKTGKEEGDRKKAIDAEDL